MRTAKSIRRSARLLFRLCLVDGLLAEDRVRHVARRLAGSRRRAAIAVLSDLHRLVRLDRDRYRASVESATSLPADVREQVRAGLSRRYGPGVHASFTHNRDLIGGMRIKIGSDVYDGSVRAKLAAIEARM